MTGFPDEGRDGGERDGGRPHAGHAAAGDEGVEDQAGYAGGDRRDADLDGRLEDAWSDPLEPLLRPRGGFLAAPEGSFERIRRRAARRRRTRALAGGTAAVAAIAGALYLVGALSTGGGEEVGPPASSSATTSPQAPPTTAPPRSSAPTPSPDPTATQRSTGGPGTASSGSAGRSTAPATPSTAAATPMCATSQLTAALGGGDAAAGNLYRYLVLTNHSSTACHVTGYPGLSLLDAAGRRIGEPATRDPRSYQAVVLQPGGSASDTVHTVNQQGTCLPASVKVRIYPPGNTAWLDVPGQITDCDDQFSITPLAPGTSGNPRA
jgi:hypothetical protein